MLKIKNIMIILIAVFVVAITSSSVFATTLNKVEYANSKITVSGTCTTSEQVTIAIFDSNKQPIYFGTVKVENGQFNSTLPASFDLEEGTTATIKIADYNGKQVSEDTFVVEKETPKEEVAPKEEIVPKEEIALKEEVDSKEKDDTPKTGTLEYIGIATVVITASILVMSVLKKKKV